MFRLWDAILDHLPKIFIIAVVCVIAFIIAAAVVNGRHVEGTVVGKDYQPTQIIPQTQCVPSGNKGSCTIVTTQTIIPERWYVVVAPDDGTDNVSRTVSPTYWEQVAVGDRWTDN